MAPAAASPEVAAHAAEPPEVAVLASAPCMVVAPSNVLSACHVTVKGTVDEHCTCPVTELYLFPDVTTVEPPEVAASAAEPPEVPVVPSYESLSCTVTAMEAVYESLSCPVTAMEAVCESSSCPVTAMEAVYESSSCPVTAMEAVYESLSCPVAATEAINELSFAHVTAYEPLSCPDPAKEADFELPVPSVTTEEVMCELHDCCVAPLGAVCELLTLPVMKSETINALYVCPVTPVIAKETINELSTHPVSVKESKFKLYVCPVLTKEPDLELSARIVQSLKCLLVQFPSMSLFLNCLFYQLLSMNCLLQSLSMPPVLICLPDHNPQVCLIQNYLYVLFQSLSPTLNFLSVQPLSRRPIPSLLPCLSQPRNPSWNP